MTNDNRSRIVVVDPQKLRQAGLVRLLESWAEVNDVEIIAVSPPAELSMGPHCAMVVLSVGSASVRDEAPQLWIRSIKTVLKEVPLVILSDHEERSEIRAAFEDGAKGFIATNIDPALALEALTFLYRGGSFFPCSVLLDEPDMECDRPIRPTIEQDATPEIGEASHAGLSAAVRITASRAPESPPVNGGATINGHANLALTPRQREVLEQLAEGKPNKVIARDLNTTEATVKVHVRQIMRKFGAANRTQAVITAMRVTTVRAK